MQRKIFLQFIKKYFKNNFPVMEYTKFTKYRVNTEITQDFVMPTINKATKFLLGLHTGEWICFGLRDQHFIKKEERKDEGEEWLEGENHIYDDHRFVKLRNGGNYDLVLYLLAHKYKFLKKFWDVGIAIQTEERGVTLGEYFFSAFPTIGDLFFLSVIHPELFPNLRVTHDISDDLKNYIATLLNNKISSIALNKDEHHKLEKKIRNWHRSKFRKSQIIQETDAEAIKDFIDERNTSMIGIMFTDIEGFTGITEKLGGVESSHLVKDHDRLIDECIDKDDDARFIKKIGDSFMVAFSKPTSSVKTAHEIQKRFYHYNKSKNKSGFEIKVRIGIHMGEVAIENKYGWDIFGRHVNIASRIESLAMGGQILFSNVIYESAKNWLLDEAYSKLKWLEHGKYRLKGIDIPYDIYEVLDPILYKTEKPRHDDDTQRLVLLVDDEELYRDKYRKIIEDGTDFDVILAKDGDDGFEKIKKYQPKVVVSDLLMPPGKWGGVTLLEQIKIKYPNIEVIILSSAGHIQKVRDVLKLGAYDYLEKIDQDDTLGQVVFEAMNS